MRLLLTACLLTVCFLTACAPTPEKTTPPLAQAPDEPATGLDAVERLITDTMADDHIAGMAVAIVKDGGIVYSKGFGFADVEAQTPMTTDTVLNIASISKTFTNAAVLQLEEAGKIGLDDDVNQYLPFRLVHPKHPTKTITFRHLLTHTASIEDGPAYGNSYTCGDPTLSLGDWIEGYLKMDGAHYAEANFHDYEPGAEYSYSNVGFGLLGYLVERIASEPFGDYCQKNIFAPLGMDETSWYLADFEAGRHATPHAYLKAGASLTEPLVDRPKARGFGDVLTEDGFVPLCLYSFPNYPDGLIRTSVHQLARFLLAHMEGGMIDSGGGVDSGRILAAETVDEILTKQIRRSRLGEEGIQGLTWSGQQRDGLGLVWGHSGGDPGVSTHMYFVPEDDIGVIVFANTAAALGPITQRLFEVAHAI